jgi:hypothetical protein
MLERVGVKVIKMKCVIACIANGMLPEPSLPDAPKAMMALPDRDRGLGPTVGQPGAGKAFLPDGDPF